MLEIARSVYEEMVCAAAAAAPLEACGLLGGEDDRISICYELTNADASAQHFSLIPAEQFKVVKDIRAQGLKMLAVWHSHPTTPARMSEEDLRLALAPDVAYVILSMARPGKPVLRAFETRDGSAEEIDTAVMES